MGDERTSTFFDLTGAKTKQDLMVDRGEYILGVGLEGLSYQSRQAVIRGSQSAADLPLTNHINEVNWNANAEVITAVTSDEILRPHGSVLRCNWWANC